MGHGTGTVYTLFDPFLVNTLNSLSWSLMKA